MMEDFEEDMDQKFFKLQKNIADISPHDIKVQVVGKAKNVNPSMEFEIVDETGGFPVREVPEEVSKIEEGKLYKVLADLEMDGAGQQYLAAKTVKKLDNFNIELYKKSLDLYGKIQ